MKAEDALILKALQEAYNRPDLEAEDITERDKVVFKAGLKEVVEWGEEPCPHFLTIGMKKRACPECWQAQLKEWGVE